MEHPRTWCWSRVSSAPLSCLRSLDHRPTSRASLRNLQAEEARRRDAGLQQPRAELARDGAAVTGAAGWDAAAGKDELISGKAYSRARSSAGVRTGLGA